MKLLPSLLALAALGAFPALAQETSDVINEPPFEEAPAAPVSADGRSLFNGQDLGDWNGDPALWSVEDGAITGKTTAANPLKHNSFLVWNGGKVGDFELRLRYKMTGGNSGIQYRSKLVEKGPQGPIVGGYQADLEAGPKYSGILYEERGRGILALRGQKVVIKPQEKNPADPKAKDFKIEEAGSLGSSEEIQASIKPDAWNEYKIIAKGNHLQHFINGKQTVDVVDEHAAKAAKEGILALQIHTGPPMIVQFKDIVLKELK